MSKSEVFYFVAQTGTCSMTPPTVSNFYVYEVPMQYLDYVWNAAQRATLGSGGLVYPKTFLEWLDRVSTSA